MIIRVVPAQADQLLLHDGFLLDDSRTRGRLRSDWLALLLLNVCLYLLDSLLRIKLCLVNHSVEMGLYDSIHFGWDSVGNDSREEEEGVEDEEEENQPGYIGTQEGKESTKECGLNDEAGGIARSHSRQVLKEVDESILQ